MYSKFCLPFPHYVKGQGKESSSRVVALFSIYVNFRW